METQRWIEGGVGWHTETLFVLNAFDVRLVFFSSLVEWQGLMRQRRELDSQLGIPFFDERRGLHCFGTLGWVFPGSMVSKDGSFVGIWLVIRKEAFHGDYA